MAEVALEADDLAGSLERGFALLSRISANEARLILPEGVHCNHKLAEALRERFATVPTLRRVVLVHPNASVRFLASSLSLLVPEIQFDVVTGDRPAAPPGADRSPPSTMPSGNAIEARLGAPDEIDAELERAFARAERARATEVVLVFDPDRAVERRLVTHLADQIQSLLGLRVLVLVHPAPVVGFMASTLALRCPRVRVIACATEDEAARVLRSRP
jgi:hypothetical protein